MPKVHPQNLRRYSLKGTFSHNKTFGASLATPDTLGRIIQYVKNQWDSFYCTAFSRSTAGSYFLGHEMSEEFQTAKEGQIAGQPIYNGADPNTGDLASEEYGFLLKASCPLSFLTDGWDKPADWKNYDASLDDQAFPNSAVSFNVYPDYQTIKTALISGKADNAVVVANCFWYSEWNEAASPYLPVPINSPISRHSYLFVDFKTVNGVEYLVAQLSQGTSFGDGGCFYMSEPVVNASFKNPNINGVGCSIFRKGAFNVVQTRITLLQKLKSVLGQLLDLLTRPHLV